MKKNILSSLLLAGLITLLAPTVLAAEGVSNVNDEERKVDSDVTIKLSPADEEGEDGGGSTEPEDQNDPDGTTGMKGNLTIDQVIVFNFNETKITGDAQHVKLASTTRQNVQVTDKRGTGTGWKLQVVQSSLTNGKENDELKILKGAYINFPVGTVVRGKGVQAEATAPIASSISTKNIIGTAQPLVTAASDNDAGMGTWKTYYNVKTEADPEVAKTEDITLYVPSGNYADEYSGTVTWQLLDSPTL